MVHIPYAGMDRGSIFTGVKFVLLLI